ncbi:MAG: sugar ABC transporter substrate-binding protein [Streptosporangiaceae bacterium]|nr:sugar ABC transporter substrate-binding protein [Streptosporangiaceae bacterium]
MVLKASAGIAAVLMATAACSSGSSGSNSSSSSSSSSPGSSSGSMAAVAAKVAAGKAIPSWTAPGPSIDVSKLKGKRVFIIPLTPNPFNENIQNTYKQIFNAVGVNYTIYANQGLTSQWVAGMDDAIAQHPNLIILSTAPDPRVLQPQLRAAKAAGIPVEVTHFYDRSSPPPPSCLACAAGVTSLVTAPFNTAGAAEADWIINDSHGHAHVLIVSAPDVIPSPGILSAMEQQYRTSCPSCTYKVINIPVAQWNTGVESQVESALNGDPSINYVDALYDAMATGAVPAVQTVGKTGSVKVVSFNGSPFALNDIRTGSIMAMDASENTRWIGFADVDQAFRLMAGMPPVNETTPFRLIDKSNVTQTGVPATNYLGYGNAYATGFWHLWGLPGSPPAAPSS